MFDVNQGFSWKTFRGAAGSFGRPRDNTEARGITTGRARATITVQRLHADRRWSRDQLRARSASGEDRGERGRGGSTHILEQRSNVGCHQQDPVALRGGRLPRHPSAGGVAERSLRVADAEEPQSVRGVRSLRAVSARCLAGGGQAAAGGAAAAQLEHILPRGASAAASRAQSHGGGGRFNPRRAASSLRVRVF